MTAVDLLKNIYSFIINCGYKDHHYSSTEDESNSINHNDNQKQDSGNVEKNNMIKIITWKGVVMFAVCVQLGNHFTNWTAGLGAGFWSLIGIMIVILTSFACEMFCIAEMTSALPFSGGTYGVVRVTLGDLPGYLLGTCEAFQYILYVAFTMTAMAKYTTAMTGYDENYEPLYWLIMYTAIAALLTFRRSLFWKSMWVFGIYILVMILLYCTMTREKVNFDYYIKDPAVGNLSDNQYTYNFFQALPNGSWFFNMAPKIMPLTCSETENPTMNVPKAMYIGYAISIVSAFAVVCCAVSISPGLAALRMTQTPLIFGFSEIFDITPLQALSFTLIAKFATCLPYAFAYSVLISSLSKSGFMGPISHLHSCTSSHSYLAGIFSGSIVGYGLNMLIWSISKDNLWYMIRVYGVLGFSVNLTIFVTYIVFKSKFSTLIKTYESPVGIYGAIYGIIIYIIVFVSVGALEDPNNRWLVFVLLVSFLVVWSAPYFLYYRHHLTYSEEESTIMFIAYVIKANQARRAQNAITSKHRHKGSPSASTTFRRRSYSSSSRTFVPTLATRSAAEETGSDRTERVTPSGTNTGDSGVSVDIECGDVMPVATSSTSTAQTAEGESVDVREGVELPALHAIPRFQQHCPAPASSSIYPNMSDIPENGSGAPGTSLRIDTTALSNTRGDKRVVPVLQGGGGAEEQVQNRGVSALDSVLTNNLRYDTEAMGRIRTEIQEFYEAQQGEGDEEV